MKALLFILILLAGCSVTEEYTQGKAAISELGRIRMQQSEQALALSPSVWIPIAVGPAIAIFILILYLVVDKRR